MIATLQAVGQQGLCSLRERVSASASDQKPARVRSRDIHEYRAPGNHRTLSGSWGRVGSWQPRKPAGVAVRRGRDAFRCGPGQRDHREGAQARRTRNNDRLDPACSSGRRSGKAMCLWTAKALAIILQEDIRHDVFHDLSIGAGGAAAQDLALGESVVAEDGLCPYRPEGLCGASSDTESWRPARPNCAVSQLLRQWGHRTRNPSHLDRHPAPVERAAGASCRWRWRA